MSIQALREQRAAVAKTLNDLVNKAEWNVETDQAAYDAGMAEIDAIDANIKRRVDAQAKLAEDTRNEQIAERADKHAVDKRDPGLAIYAKFLRGGEKALNAEDWSHLRAAMSTGTGSEGGFTVDGQVATSVLEAMLAFGGMRAVSSVIATAGGGPISFPTSNGTAEVGEIVPENQSATDEDVSFGTIALPVYKFSSKVVTVPIELLQDSAIDVEAMVRARLATRLGRITNRLFTIGTGSAQPRGVQVAAASGKTAAGAAAVTYDELVDLQHSVDPAYREAGAVRFMFNDNTLAKVRKIKDGQSRPIFVPGYETGNPEGAPDRLLGRPITINQDMPDLATGVKGILFGDFSYYQIRDVMNLELFRFTDSVYTKKGQVGFLAWLRSGGNLVDVGGAIKAMTQG